MTEIHEDFAGLDLVHARAGNRLVGFARAISDGAPARA
jgi:hypothetical protein